MNTNDVFDSIDELTEKCVADAKESLKCRSRNWKPTHREDLHIIEYAYLVNVIEPLIDEMSAKENLLDAKSEELRKAQGKLEIDKAEFDKAKKLTDPLSEPQKDFASFANYVRHFYSTLYSKGCPENTFQYITEILTAYIKYIGVE